MANINKSGIAVPRILIPDEKVSMKKWAVVACDQYVYDRNYWDAVDKLVGNAPSALRMMLPEAYLSEQDVKERIEDTKDAMYDYIESGILKELPDGFMIVERMIKGEPRVGLMVLLDLEEYEFEAGMKPLIRPTEQTIKNRIPPRMQIRMGAPVEMPHILALIDDPECTVIEPLYTMRDKFKRIYDFDLMQDGGHISGYFVDEPACIENALNAVAALKSHDGMKIAVGDGNHSLATAKEVWNRAKEVLSPEELEISPLRYAMVELVNLHCPALDIQPIHRAIAGMNPAAAIQYVVDKFNQKGLGAKLIFSRRKRFTAFSESYCDLSRTISFSSKESNGRIELSRLSHVMLLEDLQPVLEQLEADNPSAKLEYIHGNNNIEALANEYDTLCFTLSAIPKNEFMDTIVKCGVLPKKSFSLGEENEKRYYLESRLLIIPEDEPQNEAPATEQAAEEIPAAAPETPVNEAPKYASQDTVVDDIFADSEADGNSFEPEIKPIGYRDDLDDFIDNAAKDNGTDPSSIIED